MTERKSDDEVQGCSDMGHGVTRLPDGSAFAVMSMPLPADHWLTVEGSNSIPPMRLRVGQDDPRRQSLVDAVREAGRYAVRCATMNGTDDDFDPDALVQNLVVGLLGYFTADGLCGDELFDPAEHRHLDYALLAPQCPK